jgi:hypothetical protein
VYLTVRGYLSFLFWDFWFWGKLGENGQQKSDKVKMAVITALAFFLLGCC